MVGQRYHRWLALVGVACALSLFPAAAWAGINFDDRHTLTEGMTLAEIQAALGEAGKEVLKEGSFWLVWEGVVNGLTVELSVGLTDDERLKDWVFKESGPATGSAQAEDGRTEQTPTRADEPEGAEGWVFGESSDPMDDTASVALSLRSSNQLPSAVFSVNGTLYVRCHDGRLDVYVHAGMILDNESADSFRGYRANRTYVRLRYDQEKPVKSEEGTNKAEDTVFLDAKEVLPRLLGAEKLAVEITPYRSHPQAYEFDLSGLGDEIGRLKTAGCSW